MTFYSAIVTWNDAHSDNGLSRKLSEVLAEKSQVNVSVGFVLENNAKRVLLCGTLEPVAIDGECGYRDILCIPKAMVVSVKRVR